MSVQVAPALWQFHTVTFLAVSDLSRQSRDTVVPTDVYMYDRLKDNSTVGTSGGMRRSLCVPIVGSPFAPK